MQLLVVLLIVTILLALVGFFLRQRSSPVDEGFQTISTRSPMQQPAAYQPEPVPTGTTQTIALLEILRGPEAYFNGQKIGSRIPLNGDRITIGRNPRQVDVQLYNLDEPSSVSRLHCCIVYDEGQSHFLISDEASSSGTKVRGQAIRPHQPVVLQDGDEIELGMVDRLGAVLRFRYASK
jgi:pSer/pThr/pTyr-binding forkhead associated (FHA) protein